MGLFDLFKKKKKNEDSFGNNSNNFNDLADDLDRDFNQPKKGSIFNDNDFSPAFSPQPSFGIGERSLSPNLNDRDKDLIFSKLELINRKLDDIDKKLAFIEEVARDNK